MTKFVIHGLFILVHQTDGSFRELLRQSLHLGRLDPVEDDDVVDRVERRGDVVGVDHAGHDGQDGGAGEGESGSEV